MGQYKGSALHILEVEVIAVLGAVSLLNMIFPRRNAAHIFEIEERARLQGNYLQHFLPAVIHTPHAIRGIAVVSNSYYAGG
jgi:hypothetical protein